MATVWLALGADVRRRWRTMLGLVLLLGLIGGVALTAAAGARRTDTAYPRLLSWANASQLNIVPQGTGLTGYYTALARLPEVSALGAGQLYQATMPASHAAEVQFESSPDGVLGSRVDRVKVLSGRRYDPARPGEAMIDQEMAAAEHLKPGGTVRVLGVPTNPKTGLPDFGEAVTLSFTVTAIVAFDPQLVLAGGGDIQPTVLVSSPFAKTPLAAALSYGDEAAVRLRSGASMTRLIADASALARRYPDTHGKIDVINPASQVAAAEQAVRPQAIALAAFAALAGLIGLAVLSQLLSRQLAMDAAGYPVLRALGATRGTLTGLSLARLAIVTVTGAALAVVIAVTASPLMPIGPARRARPRRRAQPRRPLRGRGGDRAASPHRARAGRVAGRCSRREPARRRRARRRAHRPAVAGQAARQDRGGVRRDRRPDGVRGRPRPDRSPGAQRSGGHCHRGHGGDRRRRVRGQPRRARIHAAALRAELGRDDRPRLRLGHWSGRSGVPADRAVDHPGGGRRLRCDHDRRPGGARDRPGPAARHRLPHAAGRSRARRPR